MVYFYFNTCTIVASVLPICLAFYLLFKVGNRVLKYLKFKHDISEKCKYKLN